jgi:hypothetical protein
LVTLLPKASVFWEPFMAGPLETRVRRVAGMFASFSEKCFVGLSRLGWLRS